MKMGDHYRKLVVNVTYPTMPEVSPSTAVGTRGSLGTVGGNTVRKCSKFQRYSSVREEVKEALCMPTDTSAAVMT